jgi:septal ring factor EnvC (AmiA/AmiB activator)
MDTVNEFLEKTFGVSVFKLLSVVVLGMAMFFTMQSKLDALSRDVNNALTQNQALTMELKETNKELAKMREALIEVKTELALDRRSH